MAWKLTREEIISDLQEIDSKTDGYLTSTDIRKYNGLVSYPTVLKEFGAIYDAREAAGVENNTHPWNYPDEDQETGEEYLERLLDMSECVVCGEDRNGAIQYHHYNEDGDIEKRIQSGHKSRFNAKRTYENLQDCVPLCANCHTLHHSPRSDMTIDEEFSDAVEWPKPYGWFD